MDDLISRQAALDAMDTWDKFGCDPDGKLVWYDDDKHYVPYVHYDDMVHAIKALPSALAVRMKGWWIIKETAYEDIEAKCSCCGFETLVNQPGNGLHMVNDLHYCPNCGADMRGEVKND